jgi:hypothetical protein
MLNCNETRDLLAIDPLTEDADIHTHLGVCDACTTYQRSIDVLDAFVRPAFRWEAPTELTASLLALAANPSLNIRVFRPSRWYVSLVYILTIAVVTLSLAVAWQFISAIAYQLGVADVVTELVALPGRAMLQLTQALPESSIAIDLFLRAHNQLMWLLLVAVLWATLDRWNIPIFPNQRPLA